MAQNTAPTCTRGCTPPDPDTTCQASQTVTCPLGYWSAEAQGAVQATQVAQDALYAMGE